MRASSGEESEGIIVISHSSKPSCGLALLRRGSVLTRGRLSPGRSQEGVGRTGRGERRNVRVLKANYIKEFSVVSTGEDPLDPTGCVLDLAAIHAREEAALRCAQQGDR
ncbi:hypothetical protein PR202_ga02699 [Eleusine coracana subsp. coracana]|uniref:Uncharacterized protein n=1 Tax=Eleusine coracana subsp. coracana TaxID=191504 RepID=A0AAV5BKG7_ELECO|nr:hypothetical protein PR202_ga02699 [Eleusine coracana subsp. coracana]